MEDIGRFTLDGSEALEQRLATICETAASGVRARLPKNQLEGLLLGGGYGRGEGGVLRAPEGDQPYNDLEFYVLLRGDCRVNETRHGAALHALAAQLTAAAGIDVEFKILSRRKLAASPCSMFYHDLVQGHKRLLGNPNLLDGCDHHRHAENIPLSEATRLLMNRCSGLLFAWTKLTSPGFSEAAGDFVARNQAKAQLAFGDVVLVTQRLYHSSCRERQKRLARLEMDWTGFEREELKAHHEAGVQFKLHPHRSQAAQAELMARQTEISTFASRQWLWLEEQRLGRRFHDVWDYAQSSVNKCAETHPLRNLVINAAVFRGSALGASKLFRYPRERLLEALSVLLWDPSLARDPQRLRLVQRRVRSNATDFSALVEAYASVWRRFN
ncbi:MAG TPA: hypothetical protein VHB20_16635 [Verrucomicrobiae bacterium]|jgi:hypothetical protein|nr:hypothetical protein [Verrucomicrobiae bacterium]